MTTGNAAWLADALGGDGLTVVELSGWSERGHGELDEVWGVVCHHTGEDNVTADYIANGTPNMPGPLDNIVIAKDGTVAVIAAGVAYHAGNGEYPGLTPNQANVHTLGVTLIGGSDGDWPKAQRDALISTCAAIMRHQGQPASHVIGHKEWDQIKVDPALDMDQVRSDVSAHLQATV
jgi:hypothetical protein